MAQSPQKSDKQKKIEKRNKLKALQGFLQKNEAAPTTIELLNNNQQQQEQKLDQLQITACTVCKIELGDRKKLCGFCNEPACIQHLRKKRKSKQTHKFVKICDKCQDDFLFTKYMKFQLKNQESIAAQETIVQAKHSEIQMQYKGRKTKLVLLYHKQNQILAQKRQTDNKFNNQDNQFQQKLLRLQKKQKQLNQLSNKVNQMQARLPPSFEQDFRALQIENDKTNKQLLRLQKACDEAIKTKSRREKEIYEEYHQWEQKQKQKNSKKPDQCAIF